MDLNAKIRNNIQQAAYSLDLERSIVAVLLLIAICWGFLILYLSVIQPWNFDISTRY